MSAPYTETITIRFTERERALLEGLAEVRGMKTSDLVRLGTCLRRQDALANNRSADRTAS